MGSIPGVGSTNRALLLPPNGSVPDSDSGAPGARSPAASADIGDVRTVPQLYLDSPSVDRSKARQVLKKLPTQQIYKDAFVQVVSDEKLTPAQGKALADKVKSAYDYDTSVEKWSNPAPLQASLTVEALSKPAFDQVLGGDSTGIAGVTLGPSLMAVPADLIQTATPDDDDTLAHEANHVQDFREGGNDVDVVPRFVQEGKAYVVGDSYPIALKEDGNDPVLHDIAQALGTYSSADAADVVAHYRTGQDSANAGANGFRDEIMGALFIEYLKTHANGGQGFPDAVPRMASVVEEVGEGESYDTAFQSQFHETPEAAEKDYIQFVKDTENDPTARLKGTLWAPYE